LYYLIIIHPSAYMPHQSKRFSDFGSHMKGTCYMSVGFNYYLS